MDTKEIEVRFTYHAPHGDQPSKYDAIRKEAKEFAKMLTELAPESRELSLSITKLEESIFWANAAIARREELK